MIEEDKERDMCAVRGPAENVRAAAGGAGREGEGFKLRLFALVSFVLGNVRPTRVHTYSTPPQPCPKYPYPNPWAQTKTALRIRLAGQHTLQRKHD